MDKLSEILVTTYPKSISLDDGTPVTLRPLLKADEAALVEYFGSLPPEDRLCLKDDVTDPKVIENWIYELDYDTSFPLLPCITARSWGTPPCISTPSAGPGIRRNCV